MLSAFSSPTHEDAVRGRPMVRNTRRLGRCSNSGPRTSPRRSVPTVRPPDTPDIDRTCNDAFGLSPQAGRHPAHRGGAGSAWDSRMLAPACESTLGSIVPLSSSADPNGRLWRALARLRPPLRTDRSLRSTHARSLGAFRNGADRAGHQPSHDPTQSSNPRESCTAQSTPNWGFLQPSGRFHGLGPCLRRTVLP
jgi:hypothetical protein